MQHPDLLLRPETVDGAVVKAHVAAEHTVIVDGALEHTLNALRLQNGAEMGRKGGDIGAVEDAVLIVDTVPACNILHIADILQILLLRRDAHVAPLEGIGAGGIVGIVLEDVHTIHIQLLTHILEQLVNGGKEIAAFIKPAEHSVDERAVRQMGLAIGVNVGGGAQTHTGNALHGIVVDGIGVLTAALGMV